jgi:hypothetical protein
LKFVCLSGTYDGERPIKKCDGVKGVRSLGFCDKGESGLAFSIPSICTMTLYSVEITYGINAVISKLMTFAENAETGQFLFLIMLILSYFTCS